MKPNETEHITERPKKMSSIKWSRSDEFAHIKIISPSGWDDYDHFYRQKISKDEFIDRLAKSEFKETILPKKCVDSK